MEKDVTLCYKPPVNSFLLVEYLLYVSLEGMKVAVAKIIQGTCVYCGKENALGEVHVIPQCLFPKGLSGDMPTVGMCKSCNKEEKTANEISLIDFLLQARDSSDHPTAQQLYEKYGKRNKRLCKKAISVAKEIYKKGDSTSRWIATDALRELEKYQKEGKIRDIGRE